MNINALLHDSVVSIQPNFKTTETVQGDVVIGVGDRWLQNTVGGCILNYKGSDVSIGRFGSVSEYVLNAPNEIWDAWRLHISQNGMHRIVIEDLSLDTCFSLVLLLARLKNASLPSEREGSWVDYVTNWEQGRYMDVGHSPSESVACISSLLGHSYLHAKDSKVGLIACCEFLWNLFTKFESPYEVRFEPADLHYRRAMGRYAFEESQFQLIVQNSPRFQLLVPVQSGAEKVLTDVIVLEESTPSGIVKILLRTDQKDSWTRRGFGMMAVHRPSEAGTGNDVTISVDPDTFLTLKDLWLGLESLESTRWNGLRPNDEPRLLASHTKYEVPPVNQPWYDGGDLTLLGAPKMVKVQGVEQSGSRLDWGQDILPLLWQLYSPIPKDDLTLTPANEKVVDSGKNVVCVQWKPGKSPTIPENPTFLAWLASLSMEKGEVESPLDLPPASSFEVLRVVGGLAIVHRQGITFFDDWTSPHLEFGALRNETTALVERQLAKYKELESGELGKAIQLMIVEQNQLLASEALQLRGYHKWRATVNQVKKNLLTNININIQNESYDQSRLRTTLEQFWAVSDHRAEIHEKLESMQKNMEEINRYKKDKVNRWINIFMAGIGAGLLGKAMLEPIKDKVTTNMYEWQILMFRKEVEIGKLEEIANQVSTWEWVTLFVFISCAILGGTFYYFVESKITGASDS